jgi:bifunctional pyridoxal-dependent enzyme with beta-cystathionase and maltose regulon repressor activities
MDKQTANYEELYNTKTKNRHEAHILASRIRYDLYFKPHATISSSNIITAVMSQEDCASITMYNTCKSFYIHGLLFAATF